MIFHDDGQHHKPHFHVYYAEYEASIGADGELLAGSLPVKRLKLVQAWAAIYEEKLYDLFLTLERDCKSLLRQVAFAVFLCYAIPAREIFLRA